MAFRSLQQLPRRQRIDAPLPHAQGDRRAYSPAEMARLLERERDRTDRTGTPFAVVVFLADDAAARRDVFAALVRVLSQRLRISDEFGQLDRYRLAAVLPATSAPGAWTVADDVCLKLPADLPLPKCDVYVYPGESTGCLPDRDHAVVGSAAAGNSNGKADGNGNGQRRRSSEGKVAGPGDGSLSHPVAPCEEVATAVGGEPEARPVRPLDPLFVRPLPHWKRCLDVVAASAALVAIAPLFLLIAAAIKLTSRGPILFRQLRAGLGGRPFVCYKFRSMVVGAESLREELMPYNEQDGPAFKMRHDPRVTRVGRVLRKTSLDELPQLWNVLRGDMSLVGPRPLPVAESDACGGWHRRRLDVTPGLTCIWQVAGRSRVNFDDWVRMDIRYMRLRSLLSDSSLILRTLPAVLLGRGA